MKRAKRAMWVLPLILGTIGGVVALTRADGSDSAALAALDREVDAMRDSGEATTLEDVYPTEGEAERASNAAVAELIEWWSTAEADVVYPEGGYHIPLKAEQVRAVRAYVDSGAELVDRFRSILERGLPVRADRYPAAKSPNAETVVRDACDLVCARATLPERTMAERFGDAQLMLRGADRSRPRTLALFVPATLIPRELACDVIRLVVAAPPDASAREAEMSTSEGLRCDTLDRFNDAARADRVDTLVSIRSHLAREEPPESVLSDFRAKLDSDHFAESLKQYLDVTRRVLSAPTDTVEAHTRAVRGVMSDVLGDEDRPRMWTGRRAPDPLGAFVGGYRLLDERCMAADTQIRMARLAIRLRAAHRTTGRWPSGLDELRDPEIGQDLIDPFSGARFEYQVSDGAVTLASAGAARSPPRFYPLETWRSRLRWTIRN